MTNLKVQGVGKGPDSLTGKMSDGLTVSFGDGPMRFLSWRSFRQLVTMEIGAAGATLVKDQIKTANGAAHPLAQEV